MSTDFVQYSLIITLEQTYLHKSNNHNLQGLGKDYLFRHHGDAHEGNQISWYDVDYNGRQNAQLPPKRTWDPHKLCWLPESSDLPTKGITK